MRVFSRFLSSLLFVSFSFKSSSFVSQKCLQLHHRRKRSRGSSQQFEHPNNAKIFRFHVVTSVVSLVHGCSLWVKRKECLRDSSALHLVFVYKQRPSYRGFLFIYSFCHAFFRRRRCCCCCCYCFVSFH